MNELKLARPREVPMLRMVGYRPVMQWSDSFVMMHLSREAKDMSHKPRADAQAKAARALDLLAKGLSPSIIAERLGVTQMYVYELINKARARQEQEAPQH